MQPIQRCFYKPGKLLRALLLSAAASASLVPCFARADVPAPDRSVLARGINITHWFRFAPSKASSAMESDVSDSALAALRRAGFTYVRLAVGPEEVMDGNEIAPGKVSALVSVISRIERAGLGVMVEPHPELVQNWNLERNADARAKLLGFWRSLAPSLRQFPVGVTFPELVNEPSVDHASAWDALQNQMLASVRTMLPNSTIILTGSNWSSIDGLVKVQPVADRNVIYSFHSYEPQLLTLLGFWDGQIKAGQLAQYLPFPAEDQGQCKLKVAGIRDAHTLAVAQYWCSLHQGAVSVAKNLSRASAWGHAHGVSVIMTEFGAASRLNAFSRLAYFHAVRQSAEQLKLTWALWGLDDQMGFAQSPGGFQTTDQLSPAILQALGLDRRRDGS